MGISLSDLQMVAKMAGWRTPSANEDAAGNPGTKMQVMLGSQAKLAVGVPSSGFPAATEKPGVLNPALARWLMGFPPEWCESAAMAMQSFPNSRQRSSSPFSKQ
jgi:hypothetical protein